MNNVYPSVRVPRLCAIRRSDAGPGDGAPRRSGSAFRRNMLALFEKAVSRPPEDLTVASGGRRSSGTGAEVAEAFSSSRPDSTVFNLPNGNFMAVSRQNEKPLHPRSIVVMDDVFCIFVGDLENMCDLKRHYGLSRNHTEAMLMVEVYKVLRDRAPYPADQVIRDLAGHFAFVLFDAKCGGLFAARLNDNIASMDQDREGSMDFFWGTTKDGSLAFSDDAVIIAEGCGASSGPFPQGCIFLSGSGLESFVHPMHKVRAVKREDEEGRVCRVIFQVDLYARLPSIPRVGSDANWADTTPVE